MTAFRVHDIKIDDPEEGEDTLKHNSEFQAIATGWNDTVAGINDAVDALNGLIHHFSDYSVPKIPWTDLEATIVYPLSGNYKKIQGNADACHKLDNQGTQQYLTNVTQVSGELSLGSFSGQAALALATRMEAFGLIIEGAGALISAASGAFTGIAKVSEEIAIKVENAIITVANKLLKVLAKVVSKVDGIAGWVSLAWDVCWHGWGFIEDIVHDIEDLISAINLLFTLKDKIESWIETVKSDLATLKKWYEMILKLPDVGSVSIEDLPPVSVDDVKKSVGQIKKTYGDVEKDADGTLSDVDATTSQAG